MLFYFVFGAIVGSFLNVFVLRYNTGVNVTGRSKCPSCSKTLQWFELVPIFSWLLQGGRCTKCGSNISFQYPLVELVTAVSFSFAYFIEMGIPSVFIFFLITSLFIAIAVYDIKHTIIPDAWVYFLSFSSFLFFLSVHRFEIELVEVLLRVGAGIALALPFAFLWVVSKGKWIGLGDAKLIFGIGILLGASQGFFAVTISFVVGAIIGLFLIFLSSKTWRLFLSKITPTKISQELIYGFRMNSEIPFGPFLIGVSFMIWFLNLNGIQISLDMVSVVLVSLSSW